MSNLYNFIRELFINGVGIDNDLKSILEGYLLKLYNVQIDIKNLKFIETASHTMFFNSKKTNSLYNAPLNSIIFSKINGSNISISLATEKIKINNYSSPLYLDFFGNNVRTICNLKAKNSDVFCLAALIKSEIIEFEKIKDIFYKQTLLKRLPAKNTEYYLDNKGCMYNIDFLNRKIEKSHKILMPAIEQLDFEKHIYDEQIQSLSHPGFGNLASQVNFSQTNLINNIFVSSNKHYYLSLEEIANKLFIKKVKDKSSLIYEIFDNYYYKELIYPLFLAKKESSLKEMPNRDLSIISIDDLCVSIINKEISINVRFALLLVSLYGVETLGGRYQKLYMEVFSKEFRDMLDKHSFFNKEIDQIMLRLDNIAFLDISSMIILKNNQDKIFCDYSVLLEKPLKIDEHMQYIVNKKIVDIEKDTNDYLQSKGKEKI